MKIRYIKNRDIDKTLYDQCINDSSTPYVYAYAWFLDALCDGQWDILANENYTMVMPLPYKNKFGLSYIVQPPFVQQLGIFGKNVDKVDVQKFMACLPLKFIRTHLQFNTSNVFDQNETLKRNYMLELNDYSTIEKNYQKKLWSLINRNKAHQFQIATDENILEAIALYDDVYGKYLPNRSNNLKAIANVCLKAQQLNAIMNVVVKDGDTLLARAILFKNHKYIHYIMPSTTEEGRKWSIIHTLIDHIIETNCGKNLIFDFEGSVLPNVEVFYKKFGPVLQYYEFKKIWMTDVLKAKWFGQNL